MRVRVVLVGIEGAYNLGVIARTCVNFGVDELYLVSPVANVEEAKGFAARGRELLQRAIVVDDLGQALAGADLSAATSAIGYSQGDVLRQALSVTDFVEVLKRSPPSRLALIFGRESTGLTRSEIEKADVLVTIPANPEYPVLNVAQSVAILLWEIWKSACARASNVPPPAPREVIEKIGEALRRVTSRVLSDPSKRARVERALTRAVRKAQLTELEAKILYYWLMKIDKRLERARQAQ